MIDRVRLLAWLREAEAKHKRPSIVAVYAGLVSRIVDGQFDVEEET